LIKIDNNINKKEGIEDVENRVK